MQDKGFAGTVSRNSLFTVLYNVWYLGSRLVLTPVILAFVSIEEYGLWSYCFVVLSYLALTAFGFNSTYIRYTADYRARNENDKLNALLSTGMFTMIALGIVLFTAFWLLVPWLLNVLGIDRGLHAVARQLFVGTAAIFVLNFSLAGYQYILEGEQRIALVRKIHLAASVLEIVLMLLFFKLRFGVMGLLWAYIARFVLVIVLCAFFAHRVFPFLRLRLRYYSREALKNFTGYGNQMNVLGLLSLMINSVDRIFITRLLNLEAVGVYEIGRKLPNIGLMLPSSIAGTMMPAASHLQGSAQQDRLQRAYLRATRYLMMLSSLPYAYLIVFAPQIIEAWVGSGYPRAVFVMQILAFGTFVNLFTGIGTAFVRGIGKPGYEIKYMALSCALILVGTPLLIRTSGLAGAAWAYTIGQVAGSAYFLVMANRLFAVPWRRFATRVLLPAALLCLLTLPMVPVCALAWPLAGGSRWWQLGLLFVVGIGYVLLCALVVFALRRLLFAPDEREKLAALKLPGPLGRLWPRLWRPS